MTYTYWNCFNNNNKSFIFVSWFMKLKYVVVYILIFWVGGSNCIDENENCIMFPKSSTLICTLKFKSLTENKLGKYFQTERNNYISSTGAIFTGSILFIFACNYSKIPPPPWDIALKQLFQPFQKNKTAQATLKLSHQFKFTLTLDKAIQQKESAWDFTSFIDANSQWLLLFTSHLFHTS